MACSRRGLHRLAVVAAVTAGCAADVAAPEVDHAAEARPRGDDERADQPVWHSPATDVHQVDATRWTLAVLSDLHLPNPAAAHLERVIAALIDLRVRVVVVTGDHTNGNAGDLPISYRASGWPEVAAALQPLRDAGIAVLPVAGNHDSATASQRAHYAAAFSDLAAWAAPLAVVPADGDGRARAPFSYSVDIGGVHLALAHVVGVVEPEVARWLAADLHAASGASHRIVFGHVPLASVMLSPNARQLARLGAVLEAGNATAYIAGHEHVVWDEDVVLPGGAQLRQILVGCASGFYQYAPSEAAKQRARCGAIADPTRREPVRCTMPRGAGAFELARGRKQRHVQHARVTFTLVSVDGDALDVQPMTLDTAGRAVPFYLNRS
jgi:predicted phosphodiesterase